MARFEFVEWLARWIIQAIDFEFDWDQGNSSKSHDKHKVTRDSAEQVFRNRDLLVPLGIQIQPVVDEPRFGALGIDSTGRKLSVCFTIRHGQIRVISVRPMSAQERKHYETLRKE